mgnify:FL=1
MRPLTHFTSIPAKPRRQRYANWLRMACAVLIAGCASAMSSPLPDTDAASATDVAPGVDADVLADVEPADPQAPVDDPWEGFNRHVHGFNNTADQLVFRPLAVGYDTVAPAPVKAGVSRFFANLGMPATAVNQALQGRPRHAAQSLGRFAVNFTVGIGGVFDPATHFGVPQHSPQDFGQTLATWGWSESRYLVLPLFGPRTLRDTVAIVGDQPLSPLGQVQSRVAAAGLQMMEVVDGRARMLPLDKFRRDAFDDYLLVRDAWAQRRKQQIQQELQDRP